MKIITPPMPIPAETDAEERELVIQHLSRQLVEAERSRAAILTELDEVRTDLAVACSLLHDYVEGNQVDGRQVCAFLGRIVLEE